MAGRFLIITAEKVHLFSFSSLGSYCSLNRKNFYFFLKKRRTILFSFLLIYMCSLMRKERLIAFPNSKRNPINFAG